MELYRNLYVTLFKSLNDVLEALEKKIMERPKNSYDG